MPLRSVTRCGSLITRRGRIPGIQLQWHTGGLCETGEQVVLKKKPDLLVSGINHGSNASINIIYSGTMAAVLESAIGGVPSIGFSLLDYSHQADFSACEPYVRTIAEKVLPMVCLTGSALM